MKMLVTDEFIKLSNDSMEWIMLHFAETGISILPYGYANTYYQVEVDVERGMIYDKRIIELFRLRGLINSEIELLGPIMRHGTFYFMIISPSINRDMENQILDQFPTGAFYRSNMSKFE